MICMHVHGIIAIIYAFDAIIIIVTTYYHVPIKTGQLMSCMQAIPFTSINMV